MPKSSWNERVGVAALRNGKFHVVEYSEISVEMAQKTDEQGRLEFGSANICSHFFTLEFIRDVVVPGMKLQYHVARKAIPCLADPSPSKVNGIKLELFIFDAFPLADTFLNLEVPREGIFSPIKNATGDDSPATARADLSRLHTSWVLKAGASVEGEGDLEVSPLLSLEGEGLDMLVGKTLHLPCYLTCTESIPLLPLGKDARRIVLMISQGKPGVRTYQVLAGKGDAATEEESLKERLLRVDISRTTPAQALFLLQELIELAKM